MSLPSSTRHAWVWGSLLRVLSVSPPLLPVSGRGVAWRGVDCPYLGLAGHVFAVKLGRVWGTATEGGAVTWLVTAADLGPASPLCEAPCWPSLHCPLCSRYPWSYRPTRPDLGPPAPLCPRRSAVACVLLVSHSQAPPSTRVPREPVPSQGPGCGSSAVRPGSRGTASSTASPGSLLCAQPPVPKPPSDVIGRAGLGGGVPGARSGDPLP